MNKLLLMFFLTVISCGPSSRCQSRCKETQNEFGCQCQCDPFWECGNFSSEEEE